ncbi:hypothetical protein [Chryseobacterium indologenes]|uniref:hypothetical protein n=1 Tax=Chryseobacterium indologenes TaxID=253 RepID=UPI0021A8F023|nr:hypothetical protein [Elizabethkingia anophelis]
MKKNKKTFILALAGVTALVSCNSPQKKMEDNKAQTETSAQKNKSTDIPFLIAERYFVNNTVKGPLESPKIETQEQFDKVFGPAAAMGNNGLPTKIDFSKQFVIAVVKPDTDKATTIVPVSLQKQADGKLVFTYQVKEGEKQSHISSVSLPIIVDKSFTGEVELKEIN